MAKRQARLSAQRPLELRIEQLDPNSLQAYADNARIHSPRQIRQLTASISCFGFVIPALLNADCEIIAGHARVEAAKALGLERIRASKSNTSAKCRRGPTGWPTTGSRS